MGEGLRINDRVVIPEADLCWTAVRSSGPGGQHVNKTASKVELRFDLDACPALSVPAKARLRALCATRIDAEGQLVIVSQKTREQHRNLEDARERLAELVRRALIVPRTRRATKPTRGSKERRIQAKRARAGKKQLRGAVSTDD